MFIVLAILFNPLNYELTGSKICQRRRENTTDGVELAVTQRKIQRTVPKHIDLIYVSWMIVGICYEGHGKANWGTYKDEMVEADPNSGRPGPERCPVFAPETWNELQVMQWFDNIFTFLVTCGRKERGKKITGTQYLEDYMKSIGHEVATKPVQTVAPRRKKTGKMSLAEFHAQGQVEAWRCLRS